MSELKSGPLSMDDLAAIWEGATDTSYRDPMKAAGSGNGLEVWGQFFAQMERVSRSIDVTTQAMFISPWSGQTNPPAAGAKNATVTLSLTRTKMVEHSMLLAAGSFVVSELGRDWGESGTETFDSERRYILTTDVYFAPGDSGPVQVTARAELPGFGYNNPLPGSLSTIIQPGTKFANEGAGITYVPAPLAAVNGAKATVTIVAANEPDMFVPEHIGQYLIINTGPNGGMMFRIVGFGSPNAALDRGSSVTLALELPFRSASITGTFVVGETVTLTNASTLIATGQLIGRSGNKLAVLFANGTTTIPSTTVIKGLTSGATATTLTMAAKPEIPTTDAPVAGVGGMSWRILDWAADWGLTSTNAASPSGGVAPMLDELGNERKVYRSPGEPDESYRVRVSEVADVVSPNAIKRALNRSFAGYGWALREVGYPELPGFFFDGTSEAIIAQPHGSRNTAWDENAVRFNGGVTSGTFIEGERVILERTTDFAIWMYGRAGRDVGAGIFQLIRKTGSNAGRGFPRVWANFRIRGLRSRAIFTPTSGSVSSVVEDRSRRTWFDYEQFRAYFIVTLQRLGLGEYGYAYDVDPKGVYDVRSAYNGRPYLAAALYARVYNSIAKAVAGGVGFGLELERRFMIAGSAGNTFPAPSVLSVSPGSGANTGGYTVTVLGSGFVVGSTTVTVDGNAVTGLVVTNSGQLAFTMPATAGTGDRAIVFQTPYGTTSTVFTYVSAVSLSSINYAVTDVGGGDVLTVTGTSLASITGVEFSSDGGTTWVAGTLGTLTSTTAQVSPPPMAASTNGRVRVTDPGGTSGTLSLEFWSPTQLTNAATVLDSGKSLTSSSSVAVWTDQTANAYSWQGASAALTASIVANQFNGRPALRFDRVGGSKYLDNATSGSQPQFSAAAGPFSVYFVGKSTSTINTSTAPALDSPLNALGWKGGWNGFGLSAGAVHAVSYNSPGNAVIQKTGTPATALNDGNAHLIGIEGDGAGVTTMFADGASQGGAAGSTGDQQAFYGITRIGAGYAADNGWVGDIAAVIITKAQLTADERTKLRTWARCRFGAA